MLTLKHFFDNPRFAAAAGYDFNIIDCISFTASRIDLVYMVIEETIDFLESEIFRIWYLLPRLMVVYVIAVAYPFTFWILGLFVYAACRRSRKKYLNSTNPQVISDLNLWLRGFETRHGGNK